MVLVLKPATIAFYLFLILAVVSAAVFIAADGEQESVVVFSEGERVLIIDAGHGGADGGAISITGTTESVINLRISLKMRALADFTATPCVLTRESEDIDYPAEAGSISQKKVWDQKQRVALIESWPCAVLISVHQNEYPTGQPRGPQAFYGGAQGGVELAKLAQDFLNAALYPENRRVAAPVYSSVYLFKNIGCTAVLAECGFLSNETEARLLEDGGHQTKAALALMSAYFRYAEMAAQPT